LAGEDFPEAAVGVAAAGVGKVSIIASFRMSSLQQAELNLKTNLIFMSSVINYTTIRLIFSKRDLE
jgi:hypothetical protein